VKFSGNIARNCGYQTLFSAQKNHPAAQWQVCLAHQLRDCQYAIDAGDRIFAKGDEEVIIKGFCYPSTTR
jgi:hypothetical protein